MAQQNEDRGRNFSDDDLQDLVASTDTGARNPTNRNGRDPDRRHRASSGRCSSSGLPSRSSGLASTCR
jgi:hypothetical protein